jgi:hypothetical protein
LYEPEFVDANRIVSIVWSTKRDSGLWFAGEKKIHTLLFCNVTLFMLKKKILTFSANEQNFTLGEVL